MQNRPLMRASPSLDVSPGCAPHRWCVYLLALTDCSAFKIGFSCNLLQRLYSFSHRYFERFDLRQSLLLQSGSEAQARRIEAALKNEFALVQVSAPAWVSAQAGGHTEWFSAVHLPDAGSRLRSFAADDPATVLADPHALVRETLLRFMPQFEAWAGRQATVIREIASSVAGFGAVRRQARSLQDWLDAYGTFGIDLFVDDPQAENFVRGAIRPQS